MKTNYFLLLFAFAALCLCSYHTTSFASADPELDELIKKCKEFENNPQIKPFKTNVFCKGSRTFWELKSPDAFQLDTQYLVYNRAEMKDNQFQLPEAEYNIPSDPSWLSCRVYREMEARILSVVTVITECRVLEDMAKLGRDEFCRKVLEGEDEEDPIPTGNTYSTCPSHTGNAPVKLGAEFEDVAIKHENNVYQGPRIKRITDPSGIIAEIGLYNDDIILFVNDEKIPSSEKLVTKLNSIKGKGEYKIVALKATTNQLFSHKGIL